jgi:hypothetical protein
MRRHRVVMFAGAVVLVLCAVGACRQATPPVQRPEGFVDVAETISRLCGDTTNTFECAKAVEQYRLGKGVPGVTRTGRRLSIALRNGTVVDLTNSPDPSATDYTSYHYTEYLACFGHHLVHRQEAEQDRYLLIQADNGVRHELPGVPVLAPDCGRLAVVSGLPYGGSVLQIWRWNEPGRASLEWGYQPDAQWTTGAVSWTSPTQLSLPFTDEDEPGTSRTLIARLYTDGWRREK